MISNRFGCGSLALTFGITPRYSGQDLLTRVQKYFSLSCARDKRIGVGRCRSSTKRRHLLSGSIAGSKGFPGFGVYSAGKAAVRSFARTWLVELKE